MMLICLSCLFVCLLALTQAHGLAAPTLTHPAVSTEVDASTMVAVAGTSEETHATRKLKVILNQWWHS